MIRLGIKIPEEEVHLIYREVRKREFLEGIALTTRFQDSLFAHLPVHPGDFDTMFSPLGDPDGHGVDQITAEDAKIIARILEEQSKSSQ